VGIANRRLPVGYGRARQTRGGTLSGMGKRRSSSPKRARAILWESSPGRLTAGITIRPLTVGFGRARASLRGTSTGMGKLRSSSLGLALAILWKFSIERLKAG